MSGTRITRHEDEIRRFIDLLLAEGVRRYVEIGARDGNTFFKVMSALPAGSVGVAVDLPGAAWGWASSERALRSVCSRLELQGQTAHRIMGNSADASVIEAVRALGPYDAAFIDGDHAYAALKADWANYGPMASLVAFHDLVPVERADLAKIDVPQLWAELADDPTIARREEIIGQSTGAGIGIVWRNGKATAPKLKPKPKEDDGHEGTQGVLQQRGKGAGSRRRKGS